MDVGYVILLLSAIIILGYIGELIFKKFGVPDTLFLIGLGFVIGPSGLSLIKPESLSVVAPIFVTVTLVFLLFDGALTIDLKSFAEAIGPGLTIAFFNFCLSALFICGILLLLKFDLLEALMVGFCLGGVSSAFTIPVLKKIEPRKQIYSILTLEAAVTDVLAIVLALAMIELKVLNLFQVKTIFSQITGLFAIAGMIGTFAGFLWIFLQQKFVDNEKYHMVTVAYVFLVYLLTEYLGGNGAIASMFFGIVLANSKLLMELLDRIRRKRSAAEKGDSQETIQPVVSKRERMFHDEISFFLKTFFFVYIGMLLNISNTGALIMGGVISLVLMVLRLCSSWFIRGYEKRDRMLINSLFARGIASAVIMLMAVRRGMDPGMLVLDTVYVAITATILLSSVRVFLFRLYVKGQDQDKKKP